MEPQNGPFGLEPEQLFAEAAERIQAGEPFEVVVASYPAAARRQLRELLAIVVVANEISQADVPAPSASRSTMRRTAFLRAAALQRTERALVQQQTDRPQVAPARWSTIQQWFAGLFVVNNFRPAVAAFAIVFLLLASTSLVSLAEAAIPGDFSYPVKQWIRTQQLYLAAPEARAAVRRHHEQELSADIEKARSVVEQTNRPIQARSVLLFHGYDGDYFDIGELRVSGADMPIVGALTPGATVILRYQILPGDPTGAAERVVQGLSLEVIRNQPLEPTPAPQPTATATAAPLPTNTAVACQTTESSPAGWLPYSPEQGESVSEFARRMGVNEAEFRNVNCIFSDTFLDRRPVLIPAQPTATPTSLPTIAASVVAPTLVISPTGSPTEGPELEPTVIITLTLVPAPTETAIVSATVEPLPITPGITPVITPTRDITIPTPIETAPVITTPVVTTPIITVTAEATTVGTLQPTLSATPVVSATAVAESTATPTPIDSTTPVAEPGTPETGTPAAATPEPTMVTPLPSATVVDPATPPETATPAASVPAPTASATVAPPTAAPTVGDEETAEQPVQPPTSAPTLPPTPPPSAPVATEPAASPTEAAPISAPPEPAVIEAAGVAPAESGPVDLDPAPAPIDAIPAESDGEEEAPAASPAPEAGE